MTETREGYDNDKQTLRPGPGAPSEGQVAHPVVAEEQRVSRTSLANPTAARLSWAHVCRVAPPPFGVQLRLLVEVLHALRPTHTNLTRPPAQRCHGKLTPGCALVGEDGSVCLFTPPAEVWERNPRSMYLAPEVDSGTAPDQQADLFSVGVMLYEAVTGAAPEFDPSTGRVATSRFESENTTEPLFEVALTALDPQPNKRWSTALIFAERLRVAAGPRLARRAELAAFVAQAITREADRTESMLSADFHAAQRASREAAANDDSAIVAVATSQLTQRESDALPFASLVKWLARGSLVVSARGPRRLAWLGGIAAALTCAGLSALYGSSRDRGRGAHAAANEASPVQPAQPASAANEPAPAADHAGRTRTAVAQLPSTPPDAQGAATTLVVPGPTPVETASDAEPTEASTPQRASSEAPSVAPEDDASNPRRPAARAAHRSNKQPEPTRTRPTIPYEPEGI